MPSAEKITKLLRGKNATPESVATLASDLLLGKVAVYLPNAGQFVFDLICDRMNDLVGKNFKQWKYSSELWMLWEKCWQELARSDLTKTARARSFANVKLLQVILDVLENVYQDSKQSSLELENKENKKPQEQRKGKKKLTNHRETDSKETIKTDIGSSVATNKHKFSSKSRTLLCCMFSCVSVFIDSGYILVEEFSAMGLLKSYTLVLLLDYENSKETDSWNDIIKNLYSIPRQSASYKPSTKAIAKYYNEILPSTLPLLAESPRTLLDSSYELLHTTFCQILFEGDSISLISQVKGQNNFISSISNPNIEYLFEQALHKLAPSDVKQCEVLYTALTANKPGTLSTSLLGSLSKLNRVLSPKFCEDIFQTESENKNTNFLLLSQILSIDTVLVHSKWKFVIDGSCKSTNFSSIISNLALGFVRAREYPTFLSDVYPYALNKSDSWEDDEVVAKLSTFVNELSGNQINTLAKDFTSNKAKKPLLLLLKGLLLCSSQKQNAAEQTLLDPEVKQDNSELSFYICCIYGEKALKNTSLPLVRKGKPYSYFDLCLHLRYAELTGSIDLIDQKELCKTVTALTPKETTFLLQRWIVLIDRLSALHTEVLKKFFSLPKDSSIEYLKRSGPVFFELPGLLNSMLTYISKSCIPHLDEILLLFPVAVIRKFFMEYIKTLCTKVQTDGTDIASVKALAYILERPTLSFDLETKESLFVSLMANGNSESLPFTRTIAINVWNAHLQNIRTERSNVFVQSVLKKVSKRLDMPEQADFGLAKCILSQNGTSTLDSAEKLTEKYAKAIAKALNDKNFESYIDFLNSVPLTSEKAKSTVRTILKTYGSITVSPESSSKLFGLLTATCDSSNATFVVSLFLALRNQLPTTCHEQLIESLQKFLDTLADKDKEKVISQVTVAFEDSPDEFTCPLLDVLVLLLSQICVENPETLIPIVVSILLTFATQVRQSKEEGTLLRILHCIAASLSTKQKVFGQYSVELTMELCNYVIASPIFGANVKMYEAVTGILSNLALFHRYRFSARFHLLNNTMTSLMQKLSKNEQFYSSTEAAAAYLRLMVTLCEPQVHLTTKTSNHLTSQAQIFKTAFRKHAHVLLLNFVSIHILNPFTGEVYEKVMVGIQSLFELLTSEEIKLVRNSLDSVGRTYLLTLYSNLKANSHWSDKK